MKKPLFAVIALAGSAASMPAVAAEKTVVLSVPGMSCELCPVTVKKAISKVPGVKSVEASYEKKQAIVTFDDARTTVDALTKATANAGYPSSPAR
jgi:mercuric ion binding protein